MSDKPQRIAEDAEYIGHSHWMKWYGWFPERDLNPQYEGIPDVEHFGLTVEHRTKDGEPCASGITVDSPITRQVDPSSPKWKLEKLEPLTLSPSLLCRLCGDHGFIREGKWVPA